MRLVWILLSAQIILVLCVGCRKAYHPPDGVPLINLVIYPESGVELIGVDGFRVAIPPGDQKNTVRLTRGTHNIQIREIRVGDSRIYDYIVTYSVIVEMTDEHGYVLHGFRGSDHDYKWRLVPRQQYEVWKRQLQKRLQKDFGRMKKTSLDAALELFDPTAAIEDIAR